ncbi:hypothetical protein E2C01_044279 [Portunus trituberculatus]|uniref:Uncharacterized protein n=1 Tax=Portunus trituberculatus TaxID=210409 RepID=A0A5B7FSP9_PORTR|nr:hypothetical protein [Portunus trituberculatus]
MFSVALESGTTGNRKGHRTTAALPATQSPLRPPLICQGSLYLTSSPHTSPTHHSHHPAHESHTPPTRYPIPPTLRQLHSTHNEATF